MNVDKIRGGLHAAPIQGSGFSVDVWLAEQPRYTVIQSTRNIGKTSFYLYRKRVQALTELVADKIPGIEKRGFKSYHIDHIFPIWQAFRAGYPPEWVAELSNLRMLPHKENMAKGCRLL